MPISGPHQRQRESQLVPLIYKNATVTVYKELGASEGPEAPGKKAYLQKVDALCLKGGACGDVGCPSVLGYSRSAEVTDAIEWQSEEGFAKFADCRNPGGLLEGFSLSEEASSAASARQILRKMPKPERFP
jgi:hypothetical protein